VATDPAVDQSVLEMALADPEVVDERRHDVAVKQQRVAEFLEDEGFDALLVESPESFTWFTSGGDNSHGAAGPGHAALFLTPDETILLASNNEAGRLIGEEVGSLQLELREHRWDQPRRQCYEALCAGRKVASDTGVGQTTDVREQLSLLRLVLTPLERHRLRELGRDISQALEATARAIKPGMTEADVAAEIAHHLVRRAVTPLELLVAADDRCAQFRRPVFKQQPVRKRCTLTVTGRKAGLCAAATRQVWFGQPPKPVREHHSLACMVDATLIFFSRPGEPMGEVFRRGKRIYEKFGHPNQWTLSDQGGVTGYRPVEMLAVPESPFRFAAHMALSWCPAVGSARSQDTVLIDEQGFEIVTKTRTWPTSVVSVKGYNIERPGILVR
jgi:Xaa-Pro dipeptidase